MQTVLSLTLLGFFLGMRHATDADHVIAVSTIVTWQPRLRSALVIGTLWGIGHTLTILAVGGASVLFAVVIPPRLGLGMELSVALMLIVLGMWNLTGMLEQFRGLRPDQAAFHSHGFFQHRHVQSCEAINHSHRAAPASVETWFDRRFGGLSGYQALRPLLIGLIHGLAGSAAVALLVLGVIQNPWWAMAYLALFGAGTIAGMMMITGLIGAAISVASKRSFQLDKLRIASGLLSVGFGLFLAYQITIIDGLFTGNPTADMLR